ncbi:hypothetical protein MB901379_03589 [Mycobacterium basiliense]|uniref:Uncharacterized protein n=1 Tax=Mycobacterium basiliense TaxID=2094119 RepID=A0A3S4FPQ0_9MYCO|nr:hypothetical protein [Mycobacterium basiliense]VDM89996.1 hypothetical protein MB901379_03589 [Mycobacterium basiliense]
MTALRANLDGFPSKSVVSRSRLRGAITDLLGQGWEPWRTVAELVAEDTGATAESIDATLWRMWRAGAIDVRGRGRRRKIRVRAVGPAR